MKFSVRIVLSLFACGLIAAEPIPVDRSKLKTRADKANAANWPDNSKGSPTPHAPAENPPEAKMQRSQRAQAPGQRRIGQLERHHHLRPLE